MIISKNTYNELIKKENIKHKKNTKRLSEEISQMKKTINEKKSENGRLLRNLQKKEKNMINVLENQLNFNCKYIFSLINKKIYFILFHLFFKIYKQKGWWSDQQYLLNFV